MYYNKYDGHRIYLSPVDPADYQIYTRWLNDESLTSGLSTAKNLMTEKQGRAFLEKDNTINEYSFAIIRKEDNKVIGNYGLELHDSVSRRFHVGGFIGEKSDRGKGYGTEALALITKFAFEILNANTLYSSIFAFNIASMKAAKKAGYQMAGKFRSAYFYNGVFHDEILIEIIKEDYLAYKKQNNKEDVFR